MVLAMKALNKVRGFCALARTRLIGTVAGTTLACGADSPMLDDHEGLDVPTTYHDTRAVTVRGLGLALKSEIQDGVESESVPVDPLWWGRAQALVSRSGVQIPSSHTSASSAWVDSDELNLLATSLAGTEARVLLEDDVLRIETAEREILRQEASEGDAPLFPDALATEAVERLLDVLGTGPQEYEITVGTLAAVGGVIGADDPVNYAVARTFYVRRVFNGVNVGGSYLTGAFTLDGLLIAAQGRWPGIHDVRDDRVFERLHGSPSPEQYVEDIGLTLLRRSGRALSADLSGCRGLEMSTFYTIENGLAEFRGTILIRYEDGNGLGQEAKIPSLEFAIRGDGEFELEDQIVPETLPYGGSAGGPT